ncbi:hypothetical protein [Thermosyntropha sp.]|uniref:hypothetical protein n=1 Tax=Thermosyntropha sp. TaxID=2740820 RepID=UPI0025CC9BAC|nr:hypothetical protein [Thermosyntropha sp.]MBO8158837.1 hypothetical protein [Thermosyntropha sp.]
MDVPYDKYKTIEDFIAEIDSNFDIEFEYGGKYFSICPTLKGPSIAEWGKEDETEATFENGEALVNNYVINGRLLKDIVKEINVLSH